MITKLLIANRGEIACRIIRTARHMGVATVAVYSDADAKALHVRQADEAVHIGPSPAAESYLRGEQIIAAALETGAEAVHPGYGFLSENADFAQAVIDAGLIWVGPKPESIAAMGLKDAAKQRMREAGVPVTPGYDGADQTPAHLAEKANRIGYPVLIKAVAGGGGKGMRKVADAQDFASALESCKREASSSFGNDHVLLEKWINAPRHIEVQVFGDAHGNVVHLFERDCSLQRRHQKIIEEAPAPGMDAATREALCAAAVRAAKAVHYENAGTVEFIADASEGLRADRIFFMEMNTRLQVEHPVTEEITGVDLVEWQLRVASGEPLPKRQDELAIEGHAIEARLYAEDPASGFLPSVGRLDFLLLDEDYARIETGFDEGDVVSPFYDPMIAKIVTHAETRDDAIADLQDALNECAVHPVRTNKGFLFECLDNPDFQAARLDTGLIEKNGEALTPGGSPSQVAIDEAAGRYRSEVALPSNPLHAPLFGFGLNKDADPAVTLWSGNEALRGDSLSTIARSSYALGNDQIMVTDRGEDWLFSTSPPRPTSQAATTNGTILAPMPGKVIACDIAQGDTVTQGQRLLVLEAMKMEHALTAPFAGTVAELAVSKGDQVQVEAVLVRIAPSED